MMNTKILALVLLLTVSGVFGRADEPAAGFALESMLEGESLWSMTPESFMKAFGSRGFRWVSAGRKSARAFGMSHVMLGLPVIETVCRFESGTPSELTLYLYNRGDAGVIGREKFEALLGDADRRFCSWAGTRAAKMTNQPKMAGVNLDGRVWNKGPHQVALECSYSSGSRAERARFRAEYVRVRCLRYQKEKDLRSSLLRQRTATRRAVSPALLKKNVTRKENGDVLLDGVPMVDQGRKGYCAVAVAERVLRYYGREIDQHMLAQLAMTASEGGTRPDVMLKALQAAGTKLGCKVRVHSDWDYNSFTRMVNKYNRVAAKENANRIQLGNKIVVTEVYDAMDFELLKSARLNSRGDYNGFKADTSKYINIGIPLCWSVMVGFVPEKPPITGTGGHMRLIIGYNRKTHELLFSDTWGRGHELKRMAMDDAWAITQGLYTIEPRKRY